MDADAASSNPMLKIQLLAGVKTIAFESASPVNVTAGQVKQTLPAGRFQCRLGQAMPARYRYGAYIKSFKPAEFAEAETLAAAWRAQGFQSSVVTLGQTHQTAEGRTLDGRTFWVTVGHFASQQEADAVKSLLANRGQSVWVRPEQVETGKGEVAIAVSQGATYAAQAPLRLKGTGVIALSSHPDGKSRAYRGEMELAVGKDGTLEVYEHIDMESYLAGVLPAEMPALWPEEALKAQAIAARSDVLKHMAEKRILEGFHFLATVADRAYSGSGGRHPRTDAAVSATCGEVATDGLRILPGVFSSNCGGWTEANETAWTGPPDAALRSVNDAPGSEGPSPMNVNIARWLEHDGNAYCAADATGYRWIKRLTQAEATRLVNQKYAVGTVQRIDLGERGTGGRLLSLKVSGTKGAVTIQRELPIRQAFGGLPSAMFIINGGQSASGTAFTFEGGGRGHGVGLCQHGARGMAEAGLDCRAIIRHYYVGASVVKLR
ncbi:MAG: hypothetical protein AMXMBFR84_02530 [Candidatus Hydrogenedentota bacterium]